MNDANGELQLSDLALGLAQVQLALLSIHPDYEMIISARLELFAARIFSSSRIIDRVVTVMLLFAGIAARSNEETLSCTRDKAKEREREGGELRK